MPALQFPENALANDGGKVFVIDLDVADEIASEQLLLDQQPRLLGNCPPKSRTGR